jgi:hypothetical protein
MTYEEMYAELEKSVRKTTASFLASAGDAPQSPRTPQDEYKTLLGDIEQIFQTALRRSKRGTFFVGDPAQQLMDELQKGNHSVGERITKMRELKAHLETTDLNCLDRMGPFRWV